MATLEWQRQWREKNREKLREYQREWCHNNKDKVSEKQKKRVRKQTDWLRDYKAAAGCLDCGNMDVRVLEFDHVPERGEKKFKISMQRNWGRVQLEEELAKCDVVCGNCHNIRTYERRAALNLEKSLI